MLQNYYFLSLISDSNCFRIVFFGFLNYAAKYFRIVVFDFLSTPLSTAELLFGFLSPPQSASELLFLISYQRR